MKTGVVIMHCQACMYPPLNSCDLLLDWDSRSDGRRFSQVIPEISLTSYIRLFKRRWEFRPSCHSHLPATCFLTFNAVPQFLWIHQVQITLMHIHIQAQKSEPHLQLRACDTVTHIMHHRTWTLNLLLSHDYRLQKKLATSSSNHISWMLL